MSATTARGTPPAPLDVRGLTEAWARPGLASSLRVVLDAIVASAGFEVADVLARISGEEFRLIAGSGLGDAATAQDIRVPADHLEAALARAERWGPLSFVRSHTSDSGRGDIDPDDRHPDEWQPGDALYAAFVEEDRVLGVLSVDVPTDGRRPSQRTRDKLVSLAQLVHGALAEALEAERALLRRRASSAARSVVRRASAEADVTELLTDVLSAMLGELGAVGAWARLVALSDDVLVSDGWEFAEPVPDTLVIDLMASGARCWEAHQLLEVSARHEPGDLLARGSWSYLVERLARHGLDSLLQVPLGAGGQFLGYVVLARPTGAPAWTRDEREACLGLAHDLGSAVLNAQTFGRERRLVEKLQQVDDYKRDLVSMFSHELRTPLTSLSGHLELLEHDLADLEVAAIPMAAMRRAVTRLGDLVQDLILLSRLIEPGRPLLFGPTELGALVAEATADLHELARTRSTPLHVDLPDHPVLVEADTAAMTRAVATLVADLVTFTPRGGRVHVVVSSGDGHARISITETGEGVRSATQARLFGAVLRGVDPTATVYPGGLDLRITERIVARHDGTIDLAIDPEVGTRLLIALPLAESPTLTA